MMIRISRPLLALMVVLLSSAHVWAQATAQINGTVADSSGAVLPGVTVFAIQTETGFRREAETDATGSYALLNLPTGPYRLEATLSGFRTFAQTGVHAGGTVSLVTKSGTNLLHGDAFEFARHHRFNAASPFAGIDPATGKRLDDGLVRNQFGGVLGGKLVQDKLFFFGGYQTSRSTQTPADLVAFVPTAAMMAGDFTGVTAPACNRGTQVNLRAPFVNNRLAAAQIRPAALALAKRLPATSDPCGRVTSSSQTNPAETQSIGRVDWQINQNHSLFGRYMLTTTFWDPPY